MKFTLPTILVLVTAVLMVVALLGAGHAHGTVGVAAGSAVGVTVGVALAFVTGPAAPLPAGTTARISATAQAVSFALRSSI